MSALRDAVDRRVVYALQALVLGLPLARGGRAAWGLALALAVVVGLLALTVYERGRRPDPPRATGVGWLAAFVVLALATTVPLPPAVLRALVPATADLYAHALPGWPDAGGWTAWRALSLDPWGTWTELLRLIPALGTFAVLVAWPWRTDGDDDPQSAVLVRLVVTLVVGGLGLAGLALLAQVAGNGFVLWVTDVPAIEGRAAGPFVNPNHLAGWLEMVVPLALAWAVGLAARVRRSVARAAVTGRDMGVRARRAWIAALIAQQRRLWPPLAAAAGVLLLVGAHAATGSRGGAAALLAGLAVTGAITAAGTRRGGRLRRALPLVLAGALVVGSVASLALWAAADADAPTDVADVDVSLASRLAVARVGLDVAADHPFVGTGLGSWLHAFRPYQRPPVDGGVWDHAHDDYLELAAEVGAAGVALVLLFGIAVVAAARRPRARERSRRSDRSPDFETSDWRAVLDDTRALRAGIAGGVAAILVHSAVDFGLRMPANLLVAMMLLALLVLTGRTQRGTGRAAVATLLGATVLAAVPLVAGVVVPLAGGPPVTPADCLDAADAVVAEEGDGARPQAVRLVHAALDRAPADRDAHVALADAVGPGPDGDAALVRALELEPWAAEVRDSLAFRQLARGERDAGMATLAESMRRLPFLVSHAYLSADVELDPSRPAQVLRALAEGDTLRVRLAGLDDDVAAGVETGLRRGLDETPSGDRRTAVVGDLATLLEARGRWADAGAVLRTEAEQSLDGGTHLARAATDFLHAEDAAAAEETLLAALLRTPESGTLYRALAVDVYAKRGDYPTAETVLAAGERNAVDMTPVYHGMTEVLAQRESAWTQGLGVPTPIAEGDSDDAEAP